MKMNTALSVKVLQSTGVLPHPAVPVCYADRPSLNPPTALAARAQSTPAQERRETAVLSGPFPGCWLPSFLVQHPSWTTVLHVTGPSPHTTLPSHPVSLNTAFMHMSLSLMAAQVSWCATTQEHSLPFEPPHSSRAHCSLVCLAVKS